MIAWGSHLYAQTEEARQLLYLRDVTHCTPASAKDVRLYALGPFFSQRYSDIFARTMNGAQPSAPRSRAAHGPRQRPGRPRDRGSVCATSCGWWPRVSARPATWRCTGARQRCCNNRCKGWVLTIGYLPRALNFLPALYRVLAAPPDLPVPASPRSMPPSIREGITFERVAFTYPDRSEPVLHDLSLHLGAARVGGAGGPQRCRQDHTRQAAAPALRPDRGAHPPRWH